MCSGGPWRPVCNASNSTEMPAHIHTHLNGAMRMAKGRQASITSTLRPIWQGRLLLRIPRDTHCRWVTSTEPLPADFHRYALCDCQSVASETAVVSHPPSLSSCPTLQSYPCFPALLIFYSLLFPLFSLSLALLYSLVFLACLYSLLCQGGRMPRSLSVQWSRSLGSMRRSLTCANVDVI